MKSTIVKNPYQYTDRLHMRVLALSERGLNFWHTGATGSGPSLPDSVSLIPVYISQEPWRHLPSDIHPPLAKLTLVFACFLNRQFCNLSRYIHTVHLESQLASPHPHSPFTLWHSVHPYLYTVCRVHMIVTKKTHFEQLIFQCVSLVVKKYSFYPHSIFAASPGKQLRHQMGVLKVVMVVQQFFLETMIQQCFKLVAHLNIWLLSLH